MKRSLYFSLLFSSVLLFLQSCMKDDCTREYTFEKQIPISLTSEQIRTNIELSASRDIVNTGKTIIHNQYIFINEKKEGIHVLDNSSPSNPQNIGFIAIPGNVDLIIEGEYLIADNYIDLVSIDINNINQPSLVHREENIFSLNGKDDQGNYIVDFEYELVTEIVDCEIYENNRRGFDDISDPIFTSSYYYGPANPDIGDYMTVEGKSKEASKVAVVDEFMYTVDGFELRLFDISDASNLELIRPIQLAFNIGLIEKITIKDNLLYLSNQYSVYYFDITNRSTPAFVNTLDHATACDEITIEGDFIYVSSQESSSCNGWKSHVQVIGLDNMNFPEFLQSIPMTNPQGMTTFNNRLYVCDGDLGFKILNINQPSNGVFSYFIEGAFLDIQAEQIFHYEKDGVYHLVVIGNTGIYQYEVISPTTFKELSFISKAG